MRYVIEIPTIHHEKIQRLVTQKKYSSENEFVVKAIANQLVLEKTPLGPIGKTSPHPKPIEPHSSETEPLGSLTISQDLFEPTVRKFDYLKILVLSLKEKISSSDKYLDFKEVVKEIADKNRFNYREKREFRMFYVFHEYKESKQYKGKVTGLAFRLGLISMCREKRGKRLCIGLTDEGLRFADIIASKPPEVQNYLIELIRKKAPKEAEFMMAMKKCLSEGEKESSEIIDCLKMGFFNKNSELIGGKLDEKIIDQYRSGLTGRMKRLGLLEWRREKQTVKYSPTPKGEAFELN